MTVSGEAYIGASLLMDTLCLLCAARLSGIRARPGRVALGAAAGTGLSMAALACWGAARAVYAILPIAALMALLAFGPRAGTRGLPRLTTAGLLSAAVAALLHRLGLRMEASALACAPALWYGLRLLLPQGGGEGARADVRLLFADGGVTLSGLVDSGNLLRDPVTALPVVVAPFAALRAHLPQGLRCDDLATLPRGFRLLCVRTAGGSALLMCFRPRALYVRQGRIWRAAEAVVALSPALRGNMALLPETIMRNS